MIEKFSHNVSGLAHCHDDEDGNVTNFVVCENDKLYVYKHTERKAVHEFPRNLFNIAVLILGAKIRLPSIAQLEEKHLMEFESFSISKNSVSIGVSTHALAIFNKSFHTDLITGCMHNALSYIQATLNFSLFMGDAKLCFMALVSQGTAKSEESHCQPNQSVSLCHNYIDKNLYQKLFGIENLIQNNTMLLLFGNTGHIWFIPLSALGCQPKFLYSTDTICIDVNSHFVDEKTSVFEIGTVSGKVFQFTSLEHTYNVNQFTVASVDVHCLLNKCSTCKILSGCPQALTANGKYLLKSQQLYDEPLYGLDLDNYMKDFFSIQWRIDAEKNRMTKHLESMQQVKSLSKDVDKHFIQCTYSDHFLRLTLLSKQKLNFTSFHVVCIGFSDKTVTYNSFSPSILLLAENILLYEKILCYRQVLNSYLKVDEILVDVTRFAKLEDMKLTKKTHQSKFSIMFHKNFISRIEEPLLKHLFNIDREAKTFDIFRLCIVNRSTDVTIHNVDNSLSLMQLDCCCSDQFLSNKLYSALLQKCKKMQQLTKSSHNLIQFKTKPECILVL